MSSNKIIEKEENNYFIDFIKFILSFIVVFFHSWVFAKYPNNAPFHLAYYVVDFYFITTGYLMINSIRKRESEEDKTNIKLGESTLLFLKRKFIPLFRFFVK